MRNENYICTINIKFFFIKIKKYMTDQNKKGL